MIKLLIDATRKSEGEKLGKEQTKLRDKNVLYH